VRAFAALFRRLDGQTGSLDKRRALVDYFRAHDGLDAAWALWLLSGGCLRRIASGAELRRWAAAAGGHPEWLVDDAYAHVGDLAETLTLLVPEPDAGARLERPLSAWILETLKPLAGRDEDSRRGAITGAWQVLPEDERLLFNKLLTGALRVGVSRRSVQQALAELSGLDIALLAQRMLGGVEPAPDTLARLLSPGRSDEDRERPYPFLLAAPLEGGPDALGPTADWLLEWKWDGIRLQLLRRDGGVALWSRGEERLDGRFPEIEAAAGALPPGTVIDGELLGWGEDGPAPFQALQRRINRRRPGRSLLAEVPVRLLAYDLLEADGEDLRALPLQQRRHRLESLLSSLDQPAIRPSPILPAGTWAEAARLREGARERGVEGLMLKRRTAAYGEGRRRGPWWKWKLDPLSIDAVMLYAQAGHGRRSTLYTDYTFAVWDGDALVPVAKAYSGLDDAQIVELDRWIRRHTRERFGPVRSVEPLQVFEIGFEAVNPSRRHKSGVALRFPRILRWRRDKRAEDADSLQSLQALAR